MLGKLASGELSLIVGTHALIEPDVRFARWRWPWSTSSTASACASGRRSERDRALAAHAAHDRHADPAHARAGAATATSTRAPCASCRAGGRPIDTRSWPASARASAPTSELREQLRAGRQAYVVCPLIEEAEPVAATGASRRRRGRRRSGQRAATAELERLRDGELEGYRAGAAARRHAPAREAGGDGRLRLRAGRGAGGDDRDRGRDRRAQRDGDARSRTPSASASPSCTSCADGSGAASTARAACWSAATPAARRGCARWSSTPTASAWPRSTSSCARRASWSAPASRASASSEVARLPEDAQLLERARARAEAIVARDPELRRPSTRCSATTLARRFGAEALAPIPA